MHRVITDENQKYLIKISAFLREYRKQNGWTIRQESEYSTLHRNTILRAESGCNISVLTLIEIADTLEVSLSQLFQEL